ncbi:MAG: TetR family transcriptional regulator [Dehalococcoidia bacterium]
MMNSTEKRSGRRPGTPATREAILAAARDAFIEAGYRGATIRAIAKEAGVDPALVMHFFGSKEGLFAEAMRPPFEPAKVLGNAIAEDPSAAGMTVAQFFIDAWESDSQRRGLIGLVRSAVTEESAGAMLVENLLQPVEALLARSGADQPGLRAALVASQLIGLAITRYIVGFGPMASASPVALANAIGPSLQRYISQPLQQEASHD